MKDKRTRVLVLVTAALVGLFLLDRGVSAFITEPWSQLSKDISKTDTEITRANQELSHRDQVSRDWKRIKDRLDAPKDSDLHTSFLQHLGDLFQKAGVAYDVSENPQFQQQGDFKEYVFDTKFKLTWSQLVDLLVELHNSKEFLRLGHISIVSQYEKEDRLDVDLKISTIEHSPAPARTVPK